MGEMLIISEVLYQSFGHPKMFGQMQPLTPLTKDQKAIFLGMHEKLLA